MRLPLEKEDALEKYNDEFRKIEVLESNHDDSKKKLEFSQNDQQFLKWKSIKY